MDQLKNQIWKLFNNSKKEKLIKDYLVLENKNKNHKLEEVNI
jgi:hypothetical protein